MGIKNHERKFARFMAGRYGTDRLNQFMLIVLLVCAVINMFIRNGYVSMLLTSWEILLIVFIYIRMFSRNLTKRYAENQKYLAVENKVRPFFRTEKIYPAAEKGLPTFIPAQTASRRFVFRRENGKVSVRCPKCGTEL